MPRQLRQGLVLMGCSLTLWLAACSPPEPILKGTRISVLPQAQLEAVMKMHGPKGPGLPAIVNINAAPMPGLSAGHAGGNPRLEAPLNEAWRANIGGTGS